MRRSLFILVVSLLALALATPAIAQQGARDYDKAFGIGAGLVDLQSGAETYYTANFRFRIAGPKAGQRGGRTGSMKAYLEPEIGYADDNKPAFGRSRSTEDLLLGVNFVGVVPFSAVDFFFGGGPGIHFIDQQSDLSGVDRSDSKFGVNFHAGLDIHLNETIGLFVVGRFDLVEDFEAEEQAKIYMGLRFKFN